MAGLLLASDSAGLTLARGAEAAPVRLPLASLTKVDISVGWRGNPGKGALVGGLVLGTVTAFGTQAVLNAAYCDLPPCRLSPFVLLWGFLPGFGLGAAIGGAVGAALTSERWQAVPLDGLESGPGLPCTRLRLGWSFAF